MEKKRFSKALIQVGVAQEGADRAIGLEFEWVAKTNPYSVNPPKQVDLQLLLHGEPRADVLASVFMKRQGQLAQIRTTIRTDQNGMVSIPVDDGGQFLVSAIHMQPIDYDKQKGVLKINSAGPATSKGDVAGEKIVSRVLPAGTVWHSLWASTTFLVPAR